MVKLLFFLLHVNSLHVLKHLQYAGTVTTIIQHLEIGSKQTNQSMNRMIAQVLPIRKI